MKVRFSDELTTAGSVGKPQPQNGLCAAHSTQSITPLRDGSRAHILCMANNAGPGNTRTLNGERGLYPTSSVWKCNRFIHHAYLQAAGAITKSGLSQPFTAKVGTSIHHPARGNWTGIRPIVPWEKIAVGLHLPTGNSAGTRPILTFRGSRWCKRCAGCYVPEWRCSSRRRFGHPGGGSPWGNRGRRSVHHHAG